MKIIQEHIDKLKILCGQYHVAELYVFGSIVSERYTNASDIDFLVKFSGVDPIEYFDNYMDFKASLETLFSREIDLVEIQSIRNPILKKSIDRNKIYLYGREDAKVAV